MKTNFLFPYSWRVPGWIMTGVFGVLGILYLAEMGGVPDWLGGYMDEVITVGLIFGLLMVAFSRERDEDEYTTRIRASSLVWAVFADSAFVVVAALFVYGLDYLYVLCVQLFLLLVLYILRFRIAVCRARREALRTEA